MTDKSRAAEKALQRAVAADGRVIPVRGYVLVKDARGVLDKLAKGAAVHDEIKAKFAPRSDNMGQNDG